MQRLTIFIVCIFLCGVCQAQQYPFIHYTPKDGLISNRVRSIYQDSKGLLYFNTLNGLSVYDGARFTNYTSEDGLHNDIVNCVMEMGDDSLWVVTNTSSINCLVRGKIKSLVLKNPVTPVINFLYRHATGDLYAAADDGLFVFASNNFTKLPLTDTKGKDINSSIAGLLPYGNYLIVMRDYSYSPGSPKQIYLYDCVRKKIVSQTPEDLDVFTAATANDGRFWINTNRGVLELDTAALKKGELIVKALPAIYNNFSKGAGYIFFDNFNNCWFADGIVLKKCDPNGNVTEFTAASGINIPVISNIFQDKEGIIWVASYGKGVAKLMHSNLSLIENPFGLSDLANLISSTPGKELLLYSSQNKKIVRFTDTNKSEIFTINSPEKINLLAATSKGWYGIHDKKIFRLNGKDGRVNASLVFTDTSINNFGNTEADKNGNLLLIGSHYLTALRDNDIFQVPLSYTDQLAIDKEGKIWAATRSEQLVQFSTHPENPSAYLKQETIFEKELKGIAPRSITVDRSGNIWVGTRWKGICVFERDKEKLNLLYHLSTKNGLTENFICRLASDMENNIWACSPSGLDKIRIENKELVIENITRQNNMYLYIYTVFIDNNKTAWALSSNGIIKVTPENIVTSGYKPKLMFTQIRAGADTLNNRHRPTLSYKQNNLSFSFAAPSFLDEKQILYSYRLEGSGNTGWSEPANNATASFIDLRPGTYKLSIKAKFPAGRYPEQIINYSFIINSPWWQTWWFRLGFGILLFGILSFAIRFYYRRKLEKQKTVLEKQQAIQKERTRIATDMHDDLGAGLSRIKFLSETIGIKKQKQEPIEDEITSIRNYSNEMIDKMGEIVWALNEKNDSLSDLLAYARAYTVEYLSQNGMVATVQIDENVPELFVSGEFRRNIYLTVKEALHNIVKHSQATHVTIDIETGKELFISIHDNGTGFDEKNIRPFSNGIINMKKRITSLGGRIEIKNTRGTAISLFVPLP